MIQRDDLIILIFLSFFVKIYLNMIDQAAYIYPADLEKAKKHQLATRVFKGNIKELEQGERCQCCHRHVGVDEAGINCNYSPSKQLSFLGPGVPLLFYFAQNAGMFLLLLLGVFSSYALYSNSEGNNCDCGDSYSNRVTKLSVTNKLNNSKAIGMQTALCALFMICYFLFNQWLILRIRKKNAECDEVIDSPSDYSLIISHLPPDTAEEEIRQLVRNYSTTLSAEELQKANQLRIQKIIISYGLKQFRRLSKHRLKQFLKHKKHNLDTPVPKEPIKISLKTASFAIIVFERKLSKQLFLEYQNLHKPFGGVFHGCFYSSLEFSIRDQPLVLDRAPQPDDIIWQNADVPRSKMVFNVVLAYIFGISLLFGGGYLQYQLQLYQKGIKDSLKQQLFSIVNSASVSIVNAIILQFLRIVTKLQGQKTKTTQNRSLLVKICIYSFFNCGIFYSLAYVLAASLRKFTLDGYFAHEVVSFMTMNAIIPNIINLAFNKFQIPNSILIKLTGNRPRTQRDANSLYEMVEPDFPVQYAYIIQTIWLTCFYSPFVPAVTIISLVGIFFFYHTEAELFRTSYRVPNMLSFNLTRMACRLIDYSGLFLSSGHTLILVYIKYTLHDELTLVQLISIGISFFLSLVLIIIPSFKLNRFAYGLPHKYEDKKDYSDCLNDFQITYEETVPLFDSSDKQRRHAIHFHNFEQFFQNDPQKTNKIADNSALPFLKNQIQNPRDAAGYSFYQNRNL